MLLSSRPTLRFLARGAILASGILTSGCDDGVSTDPVEPLTLAMVDGVSSGNDQRGMTGETLRAPLRVVVTRAGVPVAGAEVRWSTISGSIASLGPTGEDGVASAVWTLPRNLSGTRVAMAALPEVPTSSVRFIAEASHPKVEILAGGSQAGVVGDRLATELAARATWDGVPLSGVAVTWFGGGVEESETVTDANGVVRGRWRLGLVAGHQTVGLRLASHPHPLHGPEAVFRATARPGPAAAMALVHAPDSSGTWLRGSGGNVPVSATVRDSYGNPVPLAEVAWVLASSRGVVVPPVILATDLSGISRGTIPIDAISAHENFTAEASLSGVSPIKKRFTVVDVLIRDDGWGSYWDPDTLHVPAGTTLSWGSWSSSEHVLGVVTPLSDTAVAVVETIGSLWAGPSRTLAHQFHIPGTYVVDCIAPNHFWERITIHVTP